MAAVYSKLLCEGTLTAFVVQTFGPPAGTKWVVRDIVAVNDVRARNQASGVFQVLDDNGTPVWLLANTAAFGSTPYHWEGHQVIEAGDHLNWFSFLTGWQFRCSGYQLTLP